MDARWERLFADLEAPGSAVDEDELPDLVEAELVNVRLVHRLAAAQGRDLGLDTRAGRRAAGIVREVGADWIALARDDVLHVVPLAAIARLDVLAGAAPPVAVPLGMAAILRRLARASLPVALAVGGEVVQGILVAVGADHCDVRTEGGVTVTIPFAALDLVRCGVAALD